MNHNFYLFSLFHFFVFFSNLISQLSLEFRWKLLVYQYPHIRTSHPTTLWRHHTKLPPMLISPRWFFSSSTYQNIDENLIMSNNWWNRFLFYYYHRTQIFFIFAHITTWLSLAVRSFAAENLIWVDATGLLLLLLLLCWRTWHIIYLIKWAFSKFR